ncbi:hypothetical protein M9Y10_007071 [Tritrichomonas musculus]|uniref:Right handed beta helix domain-containing protein n=1 Tax=Tritrichomonas musculus TaxID=1915356 RepID=A0ABR2J1B9_9EUKA
MEHSSDKSGGGIYIYLDKVIDDTIKLENLKFTSCRAVCGGGIFIYSEPTANKIDIYKCKFFSNSASIESENNDDFYGGSAIELASVKGTIIKCSFKNNVGNGVKIVNKFEDLEKSKMSIKTQLSLSITDCEFEADEESKSSILNVRGKNDEIPVEVNGCVFKGNLAEGNYHFDGELHETKNEMMNLHIKSCKFPNGIKSAVNTKNSMILLIWQYYHLRMIICKSIFIYCYFSHFIVLHLEIYILTDLN